MNTTTHAPVYSFDVVMELLTAVGQHKVSIGDHSAVVVYVEGVGSHLVGGALAAAGIVAITPHTALFGVAALNADVTLWVTPVADNQFGVRIVRSPIATNDAVVTVSI